MLTPNSMKQEEDKIENAQASCCNVHEQMNYSYFNTKAY